MPLFYIVLGIYIFIAANMGVLRLPLFMGIRILDLLFAASIPFAVASLKYKLSNQNKLRSIAFLKYFTILALLYIALSYSGYIKFFDLSKFELNRAYILRQSYFIVYSVIGFALFYSIIKSYDKFIAILKHSMIYFFIVAIALLLGISSLRFGDILLPVFCFYTYFFRSKIVGLMLLLIATYFILFANYATKDGAATDMVSFVIVLIFMFKLDYKVLFFVKKYRKTALLFSIIILAILFNFKNDIINIDANSGLRLTYWQDNINTLKQTYLLGVGFGTPYFSTPEVWFYNPGTFLQYGDDSIYVVAQHNSFINVLYRLGIAGFILFSLFNIYLMSESYILARKFEKAGLKNNANFIRVFLMGFMISLVNISFNVGLESPFNYINYLIITTVLLAVDVKSLDIFYQTKPAIHNAKQNAKS